MQCLTKETSATFQKKTSRNTLSESSCALELYARCIRRGVASSLYAVYIRRWKLHRGVRHHLALHSLERGNKSRRSRSTGVLATDPDCTVMSDRVVAKRLLTPKNIFLNPSNPLFYIDFLFWKMNVLLKANSLNSI